MHFVNINIQGKLILCLKLKCSNFYILETWCCKPLIFKTKIIWSRIILSLKYVRSTPSGCNDMGVRKSEVKGKNQFLYTLKPFLGSKGNKHFHSIGNTYFLCIIFTLIDLNSLNIFQRKTIFIIINNPMTFHFGLFNVLWFVFLNVTAFLS